MFIERNLRSIMHGSEGRNETRLSTCQVEFRPSEPRPRFSGPTSYEHVTPYGVKPTSLCVRDKQVGSLFFPTDLFRSESGPVIVPWVPLQLIHGY